MNKLGGKLKGKNIKGFFVKHGEKVGAACVAAIVLMALYSTDWSAEERTPDELSSKAADAKAQIAQSVWPAEKQEEVPVQDFLQQAQNMVADMNIAAFEYRGYMFDPLVKPPQLITDTKWNAIEDLRADAGVVLMELAPEPSLGIPSGLLADGNTPKAEDPYANVDLAQRARPELIGKRGFNSIADEDDDGYVGPRGTGRYANGRRGGGFSGKRGKSDRDRDRTPRPDEYDTGYAEDRPMTRARGQRFAAVRGLFDLRQQKLNLANSLRLGLPSEAEDVLQFRGFRIQRQRAVAGSDPWKEDNWEELDIEEAIRVLADANGFALPIVDPRVTNHYITMPLPSRLAGYWTHEATHPRLEQFTLKEEEREQLEEVVRLLREKEQELQRKTDDEPGGFSGLIDDINKIRDQVTQEQMDELRKQLEKSKSVEDRVKEIFELVPPPTALQYPTSPRGGFRGRGGMAAASRDFGRRFEDDDDDRGGGLRIGGRASQRAFQQAALEQHRRILSQLDPSTQKLSGIEAAIGRVLLFRYLDFTVKPGEAYRYRVKLIFNNPAYRAYKREQVDDEAVIQGETRESDWSEPSEVVVIPPDTHAFVTNARINDQPGRNGANFEIFQWHQELGTIIHDKMSCIFGQFIGGTRNTLVLNLAKPSFDSEQATFTSSMALVDATDEPKIDLSDHPDLRAALEGQSGIRTDRATSLGIPAEALVVKADGSTVRLDSESAVDDRNQLEENLNVVRKQYEGLKDSGDRMSYRDRLIQSGRLGDDEDRGFRPNIRDRGSSMLRKNRR